MRIMEGEVGGSLFAQAATGDEVAFARIVAAHHDDMARVAFVVCRDIQMAQEAAQAAWPIAWRKLSTVRDPAKLRPWLLAIAANEARGLVGVELIVPSARSPWTPRTTTRWCPEQPTHQIGSLRSTSRTRSLGSVSPTGRSSASAQPASHRARSGWPSA